MNRNKINKIKIYGERNSGTNFLYNLLNQNLINIELCSGNYNDNSGWKHGYPKLHLFNNLNNTLFIFIIRDLEKWLKSMFITPYHFKKNYNINLFLKNKLKSNEFRKNHDVNIINNEKNLNIFQLRYNKINSYKSFFQFIKNGIFINLENIQNDYGKNFIETLNKKFKIQIQLTFKPIIKHTKTNKIEQNKKININLNQKIIQKYKNNEFEKFIHNLKKEYLIKSIF